jgi:hypothetical protein
VKVMKNCDEEEKQNDVVWHVGDVKCAWMFNFMTFCTSIKEYENAFLDTILSQI